MLTFQVIQLCSPHATGFQYFDLVDRRRYYREDTLYANAVGHLAYGKRLAIGAAAFALDYSALKLLNTLLITFFDLHVNIHRVAWLERRMLFTNLCEFRFYELNEICHNSDGFKIGLQM